MNFISLFLISISLSLDASAVSLVCGINEKNKRYKLAFKLALIFGFFQSMMFISGYFLGKGFSIFIKDFDHWVSFVILFFIGVKMIYESFKPEIKKCIDTNSLPVLLLFAISTSIDALAVGISISLFNIDLLIASIVIGIVTFFNSFIFTITGKVLKKIVQNKAELVGGLILILIGVKILMEHLK